MKLKKDLEKWAFGPAVLETTLEEDGNSWLMMIVIPRMALLLWFRHENKQQVCICDCDTHSDTGVTSHLTSARQLRNHLSLGKHDIIIRQYPQFASDIPELNTKQAIRCEFLSHWMLLEAVAMGRVYKFSCTVTRRAERISSGWEENETH